MGILYGVKEIKPLVIKSTRFEFWLTFAQKRYEYPHTRKPYKPISCRDTLKMNCSSNKPDIKLPVKWTNDISAFIVLCYRNKAIRI